MGHVHRTNPMRICWGGGGGGGVLSHVYVYVHVCKLVCLCVYVYMGCGYVYMCAMLNGHGPSFTLFPASEEHEAFHFLVARQRGCLPWRLVELYMYMWSCADCTRSLALSLLSVKTILRRSSLCMILWRSESKPNGVCTVWSVVFPPIPFFAFRLIKSQHFRLSSGFEKAQASDIQPKIDNFNLNREKTKR